MSKAGESRDRAPGQANDYALRPPTHLTVAQWADVLSRFRAPKPVRAPGILPPPPPHDDMQFIHSVYKLNS